MSKTNGTKGRKTVLVGAKPRLFRMIRHRDGKSISGTGHVIDGVLFENGKVVICWNTARSSVTVYDSLADFIAVNVKVQYAENEFLWVEGYKPSDDVSEVLTTVEDYVLRFDEMKQKHKGAIIALIKGIRRKYEEVNLNSAEAAIIKPSITPEGGFEGE